MFSRSTFQPGPLLATALAALLFAPFAAAPAQAQGGGGGFNGGGFNRRPPFALGTVTAVDTGAGTITVSSQFGGGSQTIQTQGMTNIVTQATAAVSDLKVGDQVQVQGIPTGIAASALTIGTSPFTPPGGGNNGGNTAGARPGGAGGPGTAAQSFATATGTVASTSPLTITLSGSVSMVLKMDASAKVTKFMPAALSSVKVGDRVVAMGQANDDGTFAATTVGVNVDMGNMGGRGPGGRGQRGFGRGGPGGGFGGGPGGGGPPQGGGPPPAGPPPAVQ